MESPPVVVLIDIDGKRHIAPTVVRVPPRRTEPDTHVHATTNDPIGLFIVLCSAVGGGIIVNRRNGVHDAKKEASDKA